MIQTTLEPPHAILFVYDPANANALTPDYVNGKLVAATSDCVSIGTRAYVDGEVTVQLVSARDHANESTLHEVYRGTLNTPAKRLAIVTSELQIILEEAVQTQQTNISIFANDVWEPSVIVVKALSK